MKLWLFRISWGIDALTGAIAVVFFFIGLADKSVNADNIGIWMTAMAAMADVPPRHVDIRALQRRLVDKGILTKEVLTRL